MKDDEYDDVDDEDDDEFTYCLPLPRLEKLIGGPEE